MISVINDAGGPKDLVNTMLSTFLTDQKSLNLVLELIGFADSKGPSGYTDILKTVSHFADNFKTQGGRSIMDETDGKIHVC